MMLEGRPTATGSMRQAEDGVEAGAVSGGGISMAAGSPGVSWQRAVKVSVALRMPSSAARR